MLSITVADSLEVLATRLSAVLRDPLDDPMAAEWVAVPSSGMQRWLELRLARDLGAGSPTGGDGISANIDFARPGALRNLVLGIDSNAQPNPWMLPQLTWSVLAVAQARTEELHLPVDPSVTSLYSWVRRAADRFDRYHVHRPTMIRHWAAGDDLDAFGDSLDPAQRWQAHLWRAVRDLIGAPSPPEQLPGLLDQVRSGASLDLPGRIALFGLTAIPGGTGFLEVLDAVAVHQDVALFLLDPSPATSRKVISTLEPPAGQVRLRDDPQWTAAAGRIENPLLASWGRLARESAMLIADAGIAGKVPEQDAGSQPQTLLRTLADDIRHGAAPSGQLQPDPSDRSIQLHACYGEARQVEVLRDAILHVLVNDPTLTEDDILVVSPDFERFGPLVRAVLGASASTTPSVDSPDRPQLRYQLTDRSLRPSNAVADATRSLLELLSGPFDVVALLDFCSMTPVRSRFEFDDALDQIRDWAIELNVRWGLDAEHRTRFGVPGTLAANTWRAALDRLLLGAAVADDDGEFAIDAILPVGVEGNSVVAMGNFADLLARLRELTDDVLRDRSINEWVSWLRRACDGLFEVDQTDLWQFESVLSSLASIDDASIAAAGPAVELPFVDARRVVFDQLDVGSSRSNFFRGGVTFTSMAPLRWVPYRVVCVLGLDQTSFGSPVGDGDDVAAAVPVLGDVDRRAESRQALLEAILAARDCLIITRNGRDVTNNVDVPEAVVVSELLEAVQATVAPEARDDLARRLEVWHPRHSSDLACFEPGALTVDGPWGFDPTALAGARARRGRVATARPFLSERVDVPSTGVIELADLQSFLQNPSKAFLQQVVDLRLPTEAEIPTTHLPVELSSLDGWKVKSNLLEGSIADAESHAVARERSSGSLPVGVLGNAWLGDASKLVTEVAASVQSHMAGRSATEPISIDVELDAGVRLVGVVENCFEGERLGPFVTTMSRLSGKHLLAAWLDLLVLVATDPTRDWEAVVIGVDQKSKPAKPMAATECLSLSSSTEPKSDALRALGVVVDLWRRGCAEPIPLFPKVSQAVHDHSAKSTDWHGFNGFGGDGDDDYARLVYGDATLGDLAMIEAKPGDPPGVGGRLQRFADILWTEFENTVGAGPDTMIETGS